MQNLIPYLIFNGDCEDAFAFYKQCFDAESVLLERYMDSPISVSEKDSDKIMHASMTFWGGTLMGSDHTAEAGYTTEASGARIHLSLGCDTVGLLEETFAKLCVGGSVTMAIQDTFWGDRFGMICDKFGIHWMLNSRIGPSQMKQC